MAPHMYDSSSSEHADAPKPVTQAQKDSTKNTTHCCCCCRKSSEPVANGEKATETNEEKSEDGKAKDEKEEDKKDKPAETLDPSKVGMSCGLKNLYSGKEDKRGRFTWENSPPEDIGKPVENAETAKWALLVRNIKVYNDPRKVLEMHSIVIQSPLLKKLLERVLKGYPGVTAGLKRLEFDGRFQPLIHRWPQLKLAVDELDPNSKSEDERTTKEHAGVLLDVLNSEFKDTIESSQDLISKSVMTYEHLWTLFQPGAIIYCRNDGQETAMKLENTRYGCDENQRPTFMVRCKYVDWNGAQFGTSRLNIKIYGYAGTKPIHQLAAYPIEYHQDPEGLRKRLVERGAKFEALAGSHYKGYHGLAWKEDGWGKKQKYSIKGRVVIDTYGWNRFEPNFAIYTNPLTDKQTTSEGLADTSGDDEADGYDSDNNSYCGSEVQYDGMPCDGDFEDENEETKRPRLTEEQKLIATPLVRGYSLKSKQWLNLFVNSVREIEWQTNAFESLVLPSNQKELILGFTETQRKVKASFDDVIEGKGKGIILLLCGPPGVGKTLTAESVAEEMRVPLYMMSAGDLGLDPGSVEQKLSDILEMCTKWNAILLLDEADVFLEERSLHELERNKLVTIFLRILEYYEGIMFLTTNRVQTFDAAFQSRIHISLEYPELSVSSRLTVWNNFLAASPEKHAITERQLDSLSLMSMNGRQIKNVLKTAQLLASRKETALTYDHVLTVLDVTQHLHNANRETERTKSSIFC
ncbi:p-loop containing nucleoside triphosphate hydrolase protein [Diplodia corticola]|uniref:p-loop containing nucleoside triphosphate hydrolase protein n=1 Tax=Diplodia corticola TaxID=236234 RepID=A0A1J9R7Q2_9PEZI|nr:p-loop containing nucleoside triphosphate hydrolase protein [Diplodia corticola]OJD36616.1 p-loop containing nucleoside triphosphate hydrolase protein [Diplodia corticola]